ncbi:MAG: hypothetical protein JXX28_05030 [Deltaproteobacteria bacterium]|nr:hypothetical protein [Deltaproteobacteria bacterium]
MLQMVPLTGAGVEEEDGKPSSATQFFAIPTSKRKKPAAGPKPVVAPPATGAPPGPPPGAPPIGVPPVGGPPAGGVPMGPTPVGIQGPVASGPVAAGPVVARGGSGSPFGGAQTADAGLGADQNRSRSLRVYAIVLGLFGMAFLMMVVAVVGVIFVPGLLSGDGEGDTEAVAAYQAGAPAGTPARAGPQDTAVEEVVVPSAPSSPRTPRPAASAGGGASAPAAAPKPRPTSAPGTVTVKVAPGTPTTGVEVKCPGGFRSRGNFAADSVTITGVPQEDCSVLFKGGPPAKYTPVRGGQTLNCSFQGTSAICK